MRVTLDNSGPRWSVRSIKAEGKAVPLHKDEVLDGLARRGNVAQFVAFRPDGTNLPRQSFARVVGHEPNELFLDPREAIDSLLASSGEGKVPAMRSRVLYAKP